MLRAKGQPRPAALRLPPSAHGHRQWHGSVGAHAGPEWGRRASPDSPQPIGTTTFSDAIRFSCSVSNSYYSYNSLIYVVAGYKTLAATFGIPNNAADAAGNSATIKVYKDGTELGQPVTVALDHPQRVSLPLQGSSSWRSPVSRPNKLAVTTATISMSLSATRYSALRQRCLFLVAFRRRDRSAVP